MVYCIDFDGTLCANEFPEIGEDKPDIINFVKQLKQDGHKVILWTCRSGRELLEAIAWCAVKGIRLDAVNQNLPEHIMRYGGDTRKVFADYYIDDKNKFLEGVNKYEDAYSKM